MKAFPRADGKFDTDQEDEQGMDLMDYFAGLALQSLIINKTIWLDIESRAENVNKHPTELVSYLAYEFADAMLEARNKKLEDDGIMAIKPKRKSKRRKRN